MKIVNSPFSHKETCTCGHILKYKDSDIKPEQATQTTLRVVSFFRNNEQNEPINSALYKRLEKECRFSDKEKKILAAPDVMLKVTCRNVYHYIHCPYCGHQTQIRPIDKTSKRQIYNDCIIDSLSIYSKSLKKEESLYLWYGYRIQLLIDEDLFPKNFLNEH